MLFDTITLKTGETFKVRQITMFKDTPEEFDTFVGGADLSYRLMLGDDMTNEEINAVEEQIIFYVEPEDLETMSDEELTEYVTNMVVCPYV